MTELLSLSERADVPQESDSGLEEPPTPVKTAPRRGDTEAHGGYRGVAELLSLLEEGDASDKCDALRAFCPCRRRVYDRAVWQAIFSAARDGENGSVRDQAAHAIETLRGRLRTDPRSQEMVLALAAEHPGAAALADAIPVWRPRSPRSVTGLPPIPKFERGHRSRPNKQR